MAKPTVRKRPTFREQVGLGVKSLLVGYGLQRPSAVARAQRQVVVRKPKPMPRRYEPEPARAKPMPRRYEVVRKPKPMPRKYEVSSSHAKLKK